MKFSLTSVAALALLTAGCATREPAPAEIVPLAHSDRTPALLPDEAEREAAAVATLALAGRGDQAGPHLARLRAIEVERREKSEDPTGLADDAVDLLEASRGEPHYSEYARRTVDAGEVGPLLQRRLEVHLEQQPLTQAERRLAEHRRRRAGQIWNRVTEPASRFISGAALNPIQSGRSALSAMLVMHSFPPISTQERQALAAYEDFLDRYPDAPEADRVSEKVRRYRSQLDQALHEEALDFAQRALDARHPTGALAHLDRADRIAGVTQTSVALREEAVALQLRQDARLARSFDARARDHELETREPTDLLAAVLIAPLNRVPSEAQQWASEHDPGPLADEIAFVSAFAAKANGDEDDYFDQMEAIARADPARSNMARHALQVVGDRNQNPYAYYSAALSADRRQRVGWVMLGSRAHGPIHRDLWRPVEYLLDAPGMAVSFITFPVRLAQYPGTRARFGGAVIETGEDYVARFPEGQHSEGVHRELEGLYRTRKAWKPALIHHEARRKPDPDRIADYREKIAERTLLAADSYTRSDMRAAMYREVIIKYEGTPQADQALRSFQELVATSTPQEIRVSREFLEEHPRLWRPDALGLRPELFNGEDDDGELAEDGVILIGQTAVRIYLVDHEPVTQEVPPENFARFVAQLEEASYVQLVRDEREHPDPDPQRDLFFERARLGLLDEPDMRPAASSRATFLGSTEKFGAVRRRESLLPVELVLQGGGEDFGLSAYPRVILPRETPDAFLYR